MAANTKRIPSDAKIERVRYLTDGDLGDPPPGQVQMDHLFVDLSVNGSIAVPFGLLRGLSEEDKGELNDYYIKKGGNAVWWPNLNFCMSIQDVMAGINDDDFAGKKIGGPINPDWEPPVAHTLSATQSSPTRPPP